MNGIFLFKKKLFGGVNEKKLLQGNILDESHGRRQSCKKCKQVGHNERTCAVRSGGRMQRSYSGSLRSCNSESERSVGSEETMGMDGSFSESAESGSLEPFPSGVNSGEESGLERSLSTEEVKKEENNFED